MKRFLSLFLACLMLLSVFAVSASAASKYPDAEGHWGQQYVDYYTEKGVVKGYPDGTFRPDDRITRAEAAQVLLNYFKFTGRGKGFTDVPATAWYYDAVLASQQNGAFEGYEDGTFRPDSNISREEVIVMLRRITTAEENFELGKHFLDYHDVCDWAKGSVGALREVGVLDGYEEYPGVFYVRVHRLITRAEFIKLLFTIEKSPNVNWHIPGEPVEPNPPIVVPPAITTKAYYNVATSIRRPADGAMVGPLSRYTSLSASTSTAASPVLADIYQTLLFGHGANVLNPKDSAGNPWNYTSAFDAAFGDPEAHIILKDMIKSYLNKLNNTTGGTTKTWDEYVNEVTVTTVVGNVNSSTFKNTFLNNIAANYGSVGVGEWDVSFTTPVGQKTYVVNIKITSETR